MGQVQQTPAKVLIERYFCDCGKEMFYTGMVYMTSPASYKHDCYCGKTENLPYTYPRQTFEEMEDNAGTT